MRLKRSFSDTALLEKFNVDFRIFRGKLQMFKAAFSEFPTTRWQKRLKNKLEEPEQCISANCVVTAKVLANS